MTTQQLMNELLSIELFALNIGVQGSDVKVRASGLRQLLQLFNK